MPRFAEDRPDANGYSPDPTRADCLALDQPGPDADAEAHERRTYVEALLDVLPARERLIMRLYHGWDAGEPWTLEQISTHLGVTRERVRQLKDLAYERLRHRAGTPGKPA